ncbi:IQ domain-containing protein F1-like [Acipenser oxyrinchus oxyrinchus]|uniref:IQ domain-containing protein F1-like n=1 Tax=Acipenser oxyrinchus oxyrinchus TaxID=40147 RepID=A0AAD8FQC5_ACIOX|nr:IQ domain-containing protein F1-like [Acipenser oxyrinchus oxyrinchus]
MVFACHFFSFLISIGFERRLNTESKSATLIQAWWRGQLMRRSLVHLTFLVVLLQRWWRRVRWLHRARKRKKALTQYIYETKAAVLIQTTVKTWLAQRRYQQARKAAITIQSGWRGYTGRKKAAAIKESAGTLIELEIEIELRDFVD